jgi:hypothetical protein
MNEYYGENYFPYSVLGDGIYDLLNREENLNGFILPMFTNMNEFFFKYIDNLPVYFKHSIIDIYADINPKILSIKNDYYKELIKYLIDKKISYDDFISYTLLFDLDINNKEEFIIYLDLFTTRYVKTEIEKICKKFFFNINYPLIILNYTLIILYYPLL